MKNAILLSAGLGTRLAPITNIFNKQLVPLNNKFIIDYPIQTLKDLGVENLTVVIGGAHFDQVVSYLKDGSDKGLKINYVYQDQPLGIAQAISLCQRFVADEKQFITILGDNFFQNKINFQPGFTSQIVLCKHPELKRFGVASIKDNKIIKIKEKPKFLSSDNEHYAITGCYLFDQEFFNYFSKQIPSARGEYEITDIIEQYNKNETLGYTVLDGFWGDVGTFEAIQTVSKLLNES